MTCPTPQIQACLWKGTQIELRIQSREEFSAPSLFRNFYSLVFFLKIFTFSLLRFYRLVFIRIFIVQSREEFSAPSLFRNFYSLVFFFRNLYVQSFEIFSSSFHPNFHSHSFYKFSRFSFFRIFHGIVCRDLLSYITVSTRDSFRAEYFWTRDY